MVCERCGTMWNRATACNPVICDRALAVTGWLEGVLSAADAMKPPAGLSTHDEAQQRDSGQHKHDSH